VVSLFHDRERLACAPLFVGHGLREEFGHGICRDGALLLQEQLDKFFLLGVNHFGDGSLLIRRKLLKSVLISKECLLDGLLYNIFYGMVWYVEYWIVHGKSILHGFLCLAIENCVVTEKDDIFGGVDVLGSGVLFFWMLFEGLVGQTSNGDSVLLASIVRLKRGGPPDELFIDPPLNLDVRSVDQGQVPRHVQNCDVMLFGGGFPG